MAGNCFIYAIANAYTTLTGTRIKPDARDKAVDSLPFPALFLKRIGTREKYDAALLDHTIPALIGGFSSGQEKLIAERMDNEYSNFRKMTSLITSDSVVVFAFKGPTDNQGNLNHWLCAVAVEEDPRVVHTACPAAFVNRSRTGTYVEVYHEGVGRYSNDSFSEQIKHPFVFWDTVFRIGWLND